MTVAAETITHDGAQREADPNLQNPEMILTCDGKPAWAVGQVFCPYRVCPLGAHCDHQHGCVTGMALDKGVYLWYAPMPDGVIELTSDNFEGVASFSISHIPAKMGDWADPLRGAVSALAVAAASQEALSGSSSKPNRLRVGVRAHIMGELPIGGLSSSAAVILALLTALCRVNEIEMDASAMIDLVIHAENDYIGVRIGALDPACELLCRRGELFHLDTMTGEREWIPASPDMPPFDIAIFFSGLQRSLAGTVYNQRVEDMKAAALAMAAYRDKPTRSFAEARLRDVPLETYELYRDRLPEPWRRRAAHFFTEQQRIREGVGAWRGGDLERFGALIFQSGASTIRNMETSSPYLGKIYETILGMNGVYGGRFSGAGFKGCCMALTDPSRRDEIRERVTAGYLSAFPELEGKFAVFFCRSADGMAFSHADEDAPHALKL
ncbi:MAG: GHMP kinase [Oscillospiraceae bacterium]|nr:GHMP kinase [Oscillospiraceae bacterium]